MTSTLPEKSVEKSQDERQSVRGLVRVFSPVSWTEIRLYIILPVIAALISGLLLASSEKPHELSYWIDGPNEVFSLSTVQQIWGSDIGEAWLHMGGDSTKSLFLFRAHIWNSGTENMMNPRIVFGFRAPVKQSSIDLPVLFGGSKEAIPDSCFRILKTIPPTNVYRDSLGPETRSDTIRNRERTYNLWETKVERTVVFLTSGDLELSLHLVSGDGALKMQPRTPKWIYPLLMAILTFILIWVSSRQIVKDWAKKKLRTLRKNV